MPHKAPRPSAPPAKPVSGNQREAIACIFIFLIALAVRLPLLLQSLWYDEMYTLLHFVSQPWSAIVSGQYSPNNHILYSLLAKVCVSVGGISEITLRIPSVIAGGFVGIALGWPLRKDRPWAALAVAVIATLNPWLVTLSTEGRGYALLLLVAIVATNALPSRSQLVTWRYAVLAALAMYTLPIAVLLIVGHGIAMYVVRRAFAMTWLRSAMAAVMITVLLYSPFFAGIVDYYVRPGQPSMSYGHFLAALPHSLFGWAMPAAACTAALVLVGGVAFLPGVRRLLPVHVLAFGIAAALAIVLPLALQTSGEPRFAVWLIPVFVILAAGVVATPIDSAPARKMRAVIASVVVSALVLVLPLVSAVKSAASPVPAMPMRDAIAYAKERAVNAPIVGVYLGAEEAARIYPGLDAVAYTPAMLAAVEAKLQGRAWIVVFNDELLHRNEPALWSHVHERYQLDQQLPGRVSPALVFRPKSLQP